MSGLNLSIVMPGYNEEATISKNLKNVHHTARKLGIAFEIIFVNDGSTDNTERIVQDLALELEELQLITYRENKGRGYALRKGFENARGEMILTTESDLTWGIDIIDKLYSAIMKTGDDIVVACPYLKGGGLRNVPFKRAFLSRFGNRVLSVSLGNIVHMVSGMTRIYRSECICSIPLNSDDKEIHLEILSKALVLGYRVSEIPAILAWPDKKIQRRGKRKSSFAMMKYINSHIIFTLFERPILFFGFLGLFILIAGIILGAYIVYLWFTGGLNPTRPLMTLVVLMVVGGIIIFSFGLIGMQINDLRKEIYRLQKEIVHK